MFLGSLDQPRYGPALRAPPKKRAQTRTGASDRAGPRRTASAFGGNKSLGFDAPFCSAILLFKHRLFFGVSDGCLERLGSLERMQMEVFARKSHRLGANRIEAHGSGWPHPLQVDLLRHRLLQLLEVRGLSRSSRLPVLEGRRGLGP